MNTSALCKKLLTGLFCYLSIVFVALSFTSIQAHASVSTADPHYKDWVKHRSTIVSASVKAKTDPSTMVAMAYIESKFKGDTKRGIFQFKPRTWQGLLKEFGPKYGLSMNTKMTNVRANSLMAAELWKKNKGILASQLKRPVTDTEVYIAHFLGIGGAIKMLKAGDGRLARDITPLAAKYNRTHFYKKGKALTVAEFKSKMRGMINNPKRTWGAEATATALMVHDYSYSRQV